MTYFMTSPDDIGAIRVRTPSYSIFIPQDLHMVELEDFKYGGTNITALRLVDPSNEKVRISSFYFFFTLLVLLQVNCLFQYKSEDDKQNLPL